MTRAALLSVAAAILVGAVLRGWDLGGPSLSGDEGATFYFSLFAPSALPAALKSAGEVHPPGFFLFNHYWMKVALSESFLRLPSLLFGLLTLAVASTLYWQLDQETMVWPLALLTVSTLSIQASREFRQYALLTLLVCLALASLLAWLKTSKAGFLVGYAAACALSYWVHYLSFFALPVGLAWVLVFGNGRWKAWWGAVAGSFVPFLPWVPSLLGQVQAQDLMIRPAPGWAGLVELFSRLSVGDVGAAGDPLQIAWGAVVLVGLGVLIGSRWQKLEIRLCALWLLLPIGLVFGLSVVSSIRIFEFKYFVWTIPALCFLVTRLPAPRVVTVCLVVANLVTWVVVVYNGQQYGPNWRLASVVLRQVPPEAAIWIHPSMVAAPLLYYGLKPERLTPVDHFQAEKLEGKELVYLVTLPNHPFVARQKLVSHFQDWEGQILVESQPRLPSAWIRIYRFSRDSR